MMGWTHPLWQVKSVRGTALVLVKFSPTFIKKSDVLLGQAVLTSSAREELYGCISTLG